MSDAVTTPRRSSMLAIVSIAARSSTLLIWLVVCVLIGSYARADTRRPPSVVARVVGLEIYDNSAVVTIAAGSDQGIGRTSRARFRDSKTQKPLAGGEALIIRVDHRSSVLKTSLPPAQVRANRFVELDP
jgi:hypothetical protein